ncbi:GNAT family N-acetyltransferase [Actinomycetospora endophytica]|uniref:GNAT family N-acetyltransferase n=1 Tax=Actinomycetospora endophytica TaxID=2291215 RepID=A0ABS8PFN0_9PSEU|nr:GNAT family N-acetyltransferase [Actinomycetospora endophytica]MCD2197043.1 GNAT family N-acetyltransferase [Actinomycetospora endophytica]
MEIRAATEDDVEAAAAIAAVVAEEGTIGAQPPVDVAARAAGLRTLIDGDGRGGVWVLRDGERVVGVTTALERISGVLSIGMMLLPDARGRGGGRGLLDAVLEHARTTGAHKVDLEVWPDNGRAIALYAGAGFTVEGLRDRHYRRHDGSLRSSLIMARRVVDSS